MYNINEFQMVGRIGEIKFIPATDSGVAKLSFYLIENPNANRNVSKNAPAELIFHRVHAYGETAERAHKLAKKTFSAMLNLKLDYSKVMTAKGNGPNTPKLVLQYMRNFRVIQSLTEDSQEPTSLTVNEGRLSGKVESFQITEKNGKSKLTITMAQTYRGKGGNTWEMKHIFKVFDETAIGSFIERLRDAEEILVTTSFRYFELKMGNLKVKMPSMVLQFPSQIETLKKKEEAAESIAS